MGFGSSHNYNWVTVAAGSKNLFRGIHNRDAPWTAANLRLADLFRHHIHLRATSAILASNEVAVILVEECRNARSRRGWAIGRYVIMPNHVHFFCRAELDAKALPTFAQRWKEWSSKRMARELKVTGRVWQEEFFDHVLRSNESYSQKWEYVRENPVRAGLVKKSEDWPFQGEIESLAL